MNKRIKIDEKFRPFLELYTWSIMLSDNKKVEYAVTNMNGKIVSMHRLLKNARPKQIVDHINGDGLDNRLINLRFASHSQNLANTGRYKNNKSGYKGVHWDRSNHRWQAQISINGKTKRIGTTQDLEKAARMYDRKAREIHGEFAFLNFP